MAFVNDFKAILDVCALSLELLIVFYCQMAKYTYIQRLKHSLKQNVQKIHLKAVRAIFIHIYWMAYVAVVVAAFAAAAAIHFIFLLTSVSKRSDRIG